MAEILFEPDLFTERLSCYVGNLAAYAAPACKEWENYVMFKKERGGGLKIEINIDENIEDTHIAISCRELTPEMEKILAMLRILEKQLTVTKEDEIYFLDVSKVVYIESVDRKTFIYTDKEVYESDFKLYELEQQLESCGFFRASKSSLIQLQFIKSLKADLNRRIKVTLKSGEQLIVSRQYAEELKKRLGIRNR